MNPDTGMETPSTSRVTSLNDVATDVPAIPVTANAATAALAMTALREGWKFT